MSPSFSGNSRRLLLPAALLLAILCALPRAGRARAAKTSRKSSGDAQGKLDHVRASESALSASIAEQNREIDSMIGEVSALRQRQAAVEANWREAGRARIARPKQLEADKRRLAKIRARLHRALGVLRERLVAIYESGSPDVHQRRPRLPSWSELNARADYLNQIAEYDDSVADRVKGLRDQAQAAVQRMAAEPAADQAARDAIAVKEREVAAGRASAEARFAELKEAQARAPGARRTRVPRRRSATTSRRSPNRSSAAGAPAPPRHRRR